MSGTCLVCGRGLVCVRVHCCVWESTQFVTKTITNQSLRTRIMLTPCALQTTNRSIYGHACTLNSLDGGSGVDGDAACATLSSCIGTNEWLSHAFMPRHARSSNAHTSNVAILKRIAAPADEPVV